jgi:hypothetical protein
VKGYELAKLTKLLSRQSKLGTSSLFGLNVLLVLGLAKYCASWTNSSSDVSKFIQISIIVLAFGCLLLIPVTYWLFRHIDKTTIPYSLIDEESTVENAPLQGL